MNWDWDIIVSGALGSLVGVIVTRVWMSLGLDTWRPWSKKRP